MKNKIPDRFPDYLGALECSCFGELNRTPNKLQQNQFYLYIMKREGSYWEGLSEDTYGIAKCRGREDGSCFEFEKKYDRYAIKKGGAKGKILYLGRKVLDRKKSTSGTCVFLTELVAGVVTHVDNPNFQARPFLMKKIQSEIIPLK